MAITVIASPEGLEAARNPVPYVLETDNHLLTAAVMPYIELEMVGTGPANAETCTLTADGTAVTMEASADPGDDVFRFPLKADSTFAAWAEQLAEHFRRNHIINALFVVTHDSTGTSAILRLTLRADVPLAFDIGTLTNTSHTLSSTYTPPEYRPNFHLVMELYVEQPAGSGEYLRAFSYAKVPDSANRVVFDVAPKLMPWLATDVPDWELQHLQQCQQLVAAFWARYTERYGEPPETQAWDYDTAPARAWPAGQPRPDHPGNHLATYLETVSKLLTWQAREKHVIPEQQEFRYYLNIPAPDALPEALDVTIDAIEVVLAWDDGAETTHLIAFAGITLKPFQALIAPAGMLQLGLDLLEPNKQLLRYTWRLGYDDTGFVPLTEALTFHVDWVEHQHARQFFLQNTLGGMDTLLCIGTQQEVLHLTKHIGRLVSDPMYQSADPGMAMVPDQPHMQYQVAIGPVPAPVARYYHDLLLCHGRQLTTWREGFVPVLITDPQLALVDEENDLHSVTFAWRYAWDEPNFRP